MGRGRELVKNRLQTIAAVGGLAVVGRLAAAAPSEAAADLEIEGIPGEVEATPTDEPALRSYCGYTHAGAGLATTDRCG